MFYINNLTNNDDIAITAQLGPFTVIEYLRDLSVMPANAQSAYYAAAMNVRRRQVICDLSVAQVTVQAGAMQWSVGDVNATTGLKGVGDLFNKAVRGKVTGESAIKPEYTGSGTLVLEPTYKHILLMDMADWNGSVVLDDGLFEVVLIRAPQNLTEVTEFIQAVQNQTYNDCAMVTFLKSRKVKVYAPREMDWTLDGEKAEGTEYIEVENIHRAIRLMQREKDA